MVRVVPNTATVSVLYFWGYCGVVTAHGVWVAASTVGATVASPLPAGPAPHGRPARRRGAGADAGAGIPPKQRSLQPRRNRASTPPRVSATISSEGRSP